MLLIDDDVCEIGLNRALRMYPRRQVNERRRNIGAYSKEVENAIGKFSLFNYCIELFPLGVNAKMKNKQVG